MREPYQAGSGTDLSSGTRVVDDGGAAPIASGWRNPSTTYSLALPTASRVLRPRPMKAAATVANAGSYPTYDYSVSVLLGLGDGTFAAAVNYTAGHTPTSVAIGDLEGDQVPDLAVANWDSD